MFRHVLLKKYTDDGWIDLIRVSCHLPKDIMKNEIYQNERFQQYQAFNNILGLDDKRLRFLQVGSQISVLFKPKEKRRRK